MCLILYWICVISHESTHTHTQLVECVDFVMVVIIVIPFSFSISTFLQSTVVISTQSLLICRFVSLSVSLLFNCVSLAFINAIAPLLFFFSRALTRYTQCISIKNCLNKSHIPVNIKRIYFYYYCVLFTLFLCLFHVLWFTLSLSLARSLALISFRFVSSVFACVMHSHKRFTCLFIDLLNDVNCTVYCRG